MFRNCTSLVTAPLLPAPTLVINCYNMMFYGCNNLANMSVRFTVWPTDSTTNAWMQGSVASGTFECPAALPNSRGINWIPTGWTKVDI